jgi:hypothetical protein
VNVPSLSILGFQMLAILMKASQILSSRIKLFVQFHN